MAVGPTRRGGNAQRNAALQMVRDERLRGVVYMMDDDNAWAPELWAELRSVRPRRVGVLAVRRLVSVPPLCDGRCHTLRLLHYPACARADLSDDLGGTKRAGAHTDLGTITLLTQFDDRGGLYACRRDGEWVFVPPVEGGIVVNVQRKLGVPVKLIGLGEGPDDLAPFDPEAFVSAIVD